MNSRRFIRSSSQLEDDGRRVSRLDGRRTHCGLKCCVAICRARRKTAMGQSRHFGRRPTTSGLPPEADIVRARRHVSKLPTPDLTTRTYSARLKTASSVTSFTNGLVNFNSLSVSEVMLRIPEGLPVRFAKVLA